MKMIYKYNVGEHCGVCGSVIGKDHYCRDCGFGCDSVTGDGEKVLHDANSLEEQASKCSDCGCNCSGCGCRNGCCVKCGCCKG